MGGMGTTHEGRRHGLPAEVAILAALGVVAAVIVSTLSTGLLVLYREQCGGSCMYTSDPGPALRLAVVFLGNAAVLLTAGGLGLRRWTGGRSIVPVIAGALLAVALLWLAGAALGRL